MKFCAWCGKQIEDGDVFCAWCGKRADGSDAPAAPEPQTPAQENRQAQPQPQQQWQAPPQPPVQPQQQWQAPPQPPRQQWQAPPQHAAPGGGGGGKKGALIGGIIAAVVVAAVLVGGFVWPGFFKKDKAEIDKPATEETAPPKTDKTPAKPDAPKATEAPKETAAPKPIATPEPKAEPTPEPTEAPFVNTFSDVAEGDWFYDAVMWAGQKGVVSGTAFQPGEAATRAQALTFLWRASGEPATKLKVSPYSDVTESDWFYTPVLWGFENGLISASADGQFHAGDTLTRAQAVTFLCRALEGKAGTGERMFGDVREGDWYFEPANWAVENGIVGRGDDYAFNPDSNVTRANLITMLYRAFDPAAKKANTNPANASGFADLGVDADVDNHGLKYYHTLTKNGTLVTCNTEVVEYRVFESDDAFPARDGYEWRVLTIEVRTPEGDGSGWNHTVISTDYYNILLDKTSRIKDENGLETHACLCDGKLRDYTIWWRQDGEGKGGAAFRVVWTAQVPKGFDGIVVGIHSKAVQANGGYLNEYYTSTEDFALFRMN